VVLKASSPILFTPYDMITGLAGFTCQIMKNLITPVRAASQLITYHSAFLYYLDFMDAALYHLRTQSLPPG
jgi:hypothetical protein